MIVTDIEFHCFVADHGDDQCAVLFRLYFKPAIHIGDGTGGGAFHLYDSSGYAFVEFIEYLTGEPAFLCQDDGCIAEQEKQSQTHIVSHWRSVKRYFHKIDRFIVH